MYRTALPSFYTQLSVPRPKKAAVIGCCRILAAASETQSNELQREPLSWFSISLIGGVHIGDKALLDMRLIWCGYIRSPILVVRRGVFYLFNVWFVLAFAGGGGGRGHTLWVNTGAVPRLDGHCDF